MLIWLELGTPSNVIPADSSESSARLSVTFNDATMGDVLHYVAVAFGLKMTVGQGGVFLHRCWATPQETVDETLLVLESPRSVADIPLAVQHEITARWPATGTEESPGCRAFEAAYDQQGTPENALALADHVFTLGLLSQPSFQQPPSGMN